MPLAAKKAIAYIDQALISNIVMAKEGTIARPDFVALFEVWSSGMRAEKLVCPRSWFHREEGSLTSLDPAIQRDLCFISQLDFEPPFELEKRQFYSSTTQLAPSSDSRHTTRVGESAWKVTRTSDSGGSP